MEIKSLSDEELAVMAKAETARSEAALEELLKRYKSAVNSIARGYFLSGGDTDDLLQEGMMGVFKSAIKKSNRDKNKPLNNFISLSSESGDDADKNELMRGEEINPEEAYINMEAEKELIAEIESALSELEYRVLSLYLQGFSYDDIAKRTGKNVKSVDNTVQRIRNKLNRVKHAVKEK